MKFISITKITLAAFLLATVSVSHADPELDRLKATYAQDLEKLYQSYSQAGRLDDATRVLAELKAIGVAGADMHPVSEELFVNTAWKTPSGTIFEFQANHRGSRSFNNADRTLLIWKSLPDGLVEVTGRAGQGQAETTWYFRFESKTEAYYGSRKNDVVHKLQKQR